MKTTTALLHDSAKIDIEISGSGPAILLPVNPIVITGEDAKAKEQWGMDPALGRNLIDGLNDAFTVVAFDYEGFRMQSPAPDTLTPENIAHDFLAVADAAGVGQFAYYGFSWLGLSGLQLAIRTDRLWALITGGFPPINGPYKQMLTVTKTTHDMTTKPQKTQPVKQKSDDTEFDWDAIDMILSEGQTRQFVTLYEALQSFDDRAVQNKITCPRLTFAGSEDTIVYGKKWGDVIVDIAGPLITKTDEITSYGWDVQVLPGLDHMSAMQPINVLPVIRPWLVVFKRRGINLTL
jgi:pimeloyl-ACP methyl ester carboxylesterase